MKGLKAALPNLDVSTGWDIAELMKKVEEEKKKAEDEKKKAEEDKKAEEAKKAEQEKAKAAEKKKEEEKAKAAEKKTDDKPAENKMDAAAREGRKEQVGRRSSTQHLRERGGQALVLRQ